MNFNELRLGNWVIHKPTKLLGTVESISRHCISIKPLGDEEHICVADEQGWIGLELTDEVLKDCGFDIEKQGWPELIIPDVQDVEVRIAISNGACVIDQLGGEYGISFKTAVDMYNETPEEDRDGFEWGSFAGRDSTVVFEDIPYLHQLQNRYYDITHKELPNVYDNTLHTEPAADQE